MSEEEKRPRRPKPPVGSALQYATIGSSNGEEEKEQTAKKFEEETQAEVPSAPVSETQSQSATTLPPSMMPETQASSQTKVKAQTEPTVSPASITQALPSTSTQTETAANTFAENPFLGRHYGPEAYEHTHKRMTFWVDKGQEKRLNKLAKKVRRAKAALFYEAMEDLLKKYGEGDSPSPAQPEKH